MIYVVLSGILLRLLERAKVYTTEMKLGRILNLPITFTLYLGFKGPTWDVSTESYMNLVFWNS